MATVRQKQCLLAYLGYYTGNIDNTWGQKSREATKAFQKDQNITQDGDFGNNTLAKAKYAVYHDQFKKTDTTTNNTQTQQTVSTPTITTPTQNKVNTGTFWDEIEYFTPQEFACHCGGTYCNGYPTEMDPVLIKAADKLRKHYKKPMNVSSGSRCAKHNANVGGVYNSRHLLGKAMDFAISGVSASEVVTWIKNNLPEIRYTYAINANYVHMDTP